MTIDTLIGLDIPPLFRGNKRDNREFVEFIPRSEERNTDQVGELEFNN